MLERYADHKADDATVQYHMKHLRAFFKPYTASQLSNQVMRDYAKHRTNQPTIRGKDSGNKTVSPATVRRELGTLSAAFGFNRKEGYLKEVIHIEKPPESAPRERWLSYDEQTKLLSECRTPHLKLYVQIALTTAARPSSILELKWFQVDTVARVIHFNPEGRHQTKKRRPSVVINSSLLPALLEAKANAKSEYVISRKNGRRVASIKKGIREAAIRSDLEGVTAYTLRHTAITMMIRGGVSLALAGQVAGHNDPRTTSRYAKHDPSFTRDAVELLHTGEKLAHKTAKMGKNTPIAAKNKVKKQCG